MPNYINPWRLWTGLWIPTWLLEMQELSLGAKMCYASLCFLAGKNGVCRPKQETIGRRAGLRIGTPESIARQTRRYLDELVSVGLIEVTAEPSFQRRNQYRFLSHPSMRSRQPDNLSYSNRTVMSGSNRTQVSGSTDIEVKKEELHMVDSGESVSVNGERKQTRKANPLVKQPPTYTSNFLEVWGALPKRVGGDSKPDAFKAYRARIREGVKHEELLDGATRYAAFCDAEGITDTRFAMQGATFFGPGRHWENEWEISNPNGRKK